jgi:tRNA threonylcarbamoyladenosine biosynthesis protein TsaB
MVLKVLGIDSSAKPASAAVVENGKIISSFYINTGLTHSQTLMPMIDSVLKCANITLDDIDLIAVNNGPGSFTGIRIGVAAVKGIADVKSKSCLGVSTLESMAYNLCGYDCIACAVMDARCNQVYTALFDISNGKVTRITEDNAISVDELEKALKNYNKTKIFVGDGAEMCYNTFGKNFDDIKLPIESQKFQNAVSVCLAAEQYNASEYVKASELMPKYLRLPQAQRNLKNKLK